MFLPNLGFAAADEDVTVLVVPGRDPVSPPELSADTPVLDIVHPVKVGLRPVRGYESNPTGFDGLDGGFRECLDAHVPLVGQVRLDHSTAAIAAWNLDQIRLYLVEQPE